MKGLIRHIGVVHSQQPNFHIVCGISGCPRTYNNFLSYKKHVYRKHKLYLDIENGNHQDVVLNSEEDIHVGLFQLHPEIPETSSTGTGTCTPQDGKSYAALTLLKMKQEYKISETAVSGLIHIETFTSLLHFKLSQIENLLSSTCAIEFHNVTNTALCITSPFCGLETKYL
jgi:hypothetical protein